MTPENILDRRLLESGWLEKLKKRNIEVHARSIFLQGILLGRYNQLPTKLKKLSQILKKWKNTIGVSAGNRNNSWSLGYEYYTTFPIYEGLVFDLGLFKRNDVNFLITFIKNINFRC